MAAEEPGSDADLLRRSAGGDRDAFARLYRRHHGAVYRFARLMTGSSGIAEDIVQEVFLALMRSASRFDPARASLTSYLYGSARRLTRRRLFRERLFVAFDEEALERCERAEGAQAPPDLAHERDLRDLRRAILKLPPRYREIIVLCDLQGVSYADAADSLGCALGTVRSRLHRARQLLAERMRRGAACASLASSSNVRCEA